MLDLLAARNARRDDLGVERLRHHSRSQASLAQRHGNVVMLLLEPEGTSHPATARIYFNDFKVRPLENSDCRSRAHHRFLMAVAVKQRPSRPCLKVQGQTIGS